MRENLWVVPKSYQRQGQPRTLKEFFTGNGRAVWGPPKIRVILLLVLLFVNVVVVVVVTVIVVMVMVCPFVS